MKRILQFIGAAGLFAALTAAPAGAHCTDAWHWDEGSPHDGMPKGGSGSSTPGETPGDPRIDGQPDPQRSQPTVVNEPDGSQRITVALSDPGRPASLEMDLVMGNITVKGTNRRDVLIEARGKNNAPIRRRGADEPPPPGMRRLTQSAPFSVEEDRNTVSIDIDGPPRSIDFTIEVPMRGNLQIETVQGSVNVDGVDGDLEIDSVNGEVTLTNVGGSVVAHSVNGRLVASIARTAPQKPMAFTSMNGSVDVTLPQAVKANLKLRSDQGDVFTDFDLQVKPDPDDPDVQVGRRNVSRTRVNVDHSIYGSVNGGGPDFEIRTFNGNVYVRKAR